MRYRAEIDGLRAVAVLPVILFHAGIAPFGGGFVGVDVFFVISGYLITRLIASDLDAGSFRLGEFYERRARRILPALFLVTICALPFAWLWMLPDPFTDFLQSVIATATFWSNFLFWSEIGYFAGPAADKPLLHTWSLAIEEQFYILFPLLLMALWRLARHAVAVTLAGLAVLSFAASAWLTHTEPSAAFYLLPTRAWELLTGALCALRLRRGAVPVASSARQILALSGLALIGLAVFAYDDTTPFPGLAAAVPVAGTALLILFAAPGTLAHRVLGWGILTKIGLISYSAYLWHHPIFAFLRIRSLAEPSAQHYAGAILATFALAWLTWKFVEMPCRDRRDPLRLLSTRTRVLALSAITITGIAAFGAALLATDARSGRTRDTPLGPVSLADLRTQLRPNRGLADICNGAASLSAPECRTSDAPRLAVWGDSYAMHILDLLDAALPDAGVVQLTQSVCIPVAGVSAFSRADAHTARRARECIAFNNAVMDLLRATPSIEVVLVSSPFDALLGDGPLLQRDGAVTENANRRYARAFEDTLDAIAALGKRPVVVSPPPRDGRNLGDCVAKRLLFGAPLDPCDVALSRVTSDHAMVNGYLRSLEPRHQVLWLEDLICADGTCRPYRDGGLLYRDAGHLSHWGARWLGEAEPDAIRSVVTGMRSLGAP